MIGEFKKFIDVQVPIEGCTLRCHYCYVTHHRLFNNTTPLFKYDVKTWKEAFDPQRWGGRCMVNFCACGETLLAPIMVDYIGATLAQGHFVMVVTNATIDAAFDRMISEYSSEMISRLFFKFSYHYQQLLERRLTERFFNNIRKVRDAGASFTLELTPHDELMPDIESIKAQAKQQLGAWPHITIARDEHHMNKLPILTKLSREEYRKTWSVFDSKLFDFKESIFNVKRTEFCNAGNWTFALEMGTGILKQCYCSWYNQNILDDPIKPINFKPIGHFCKEPHCFNGHSWLGFGTIPELKTPHYTDMRNRICQDGTEWLTPVMKEAMNTKLQDTNRPLSLVDKFVADCDMMIMICKSKIIKILDRIMCIA